MPESPSKLALILGCADEPEAMADRAKLLVESLRIHTDAFASGVAAKSAAQLIDSISDVFGCASDDFDALFAGWRAHAEAMGSAGALLDALEVPDSEPLNDTVARIKAERAEATTLRGEIEGHARDGGSVVADCKLFLGATDPGDVRASLAAMARTLAAIEMVLELDPTYRTFKERWKGIFRAIVELRDEATHTRAILGALHGDTV